MDDMKKTDYRVEKDSIGVKDIPEEVYCVQQKTFTSQV